MELMNIFLLKKYLIFFKQANTCIVGYNNIHFDDEITRNIFYRNFLILMNGAGKMVIPVGMYYLY